MNNKSISNLFLAAALSLISITTYAQNFEGTITYKVEAYNPMPDMVTEEQWQELIKEQFGQRGYMIQKYSYKQDKYLSSIDAGMHHGFQAYNPKDKLLYSWQANSDTATTVNSKKYLDEFVSITPKDTVATIMNISCQAIIVKSKMGSMTVYYNSDYLKMDANLYKGHLYGHWEQILKHTGCLPLKVETQGFMTKIVQTATEFKQESISDDRFTIPKFKTVIANPVN